MSLGIPIAPDKVASSDAARPLRRYRKTRASRLAIAGKISRRSNRSADRAPLRLVSALVTASRLILGQEAGAAALTRKDRTKAGVRHVGAGHWQNAPTRQHIHSKISGCADAPVSA